MRTWFAPAKLNLFLHITDRRTDGYHLLQTVFQFVTLADRIQFEITEKTAMIKRASVSTTIPEAEDLTIKAAKKLQQLGKCQAGVRIHIEKKIPVGGGLGGGSSDAATTLVALNQLWRLDLPQQKLLEIGLELGADVPFFINGQAAWAEGIGEKLQHIALSEPWYLIVYPACHVSTAQVFKRISLTQTTSPIRIADFFDGKGKNDCEPIVRSAYPPVAKALDWLDQYAAAKMTGTGACVFAAFTEKERALSVSRQLPDKWQGFVTQGQNRSLLFADQPCCEDFYTS